VQSAVRRRKGGNASKPGRRERTRLTKEEKGPRFPLILNTYIPSTTPRPSKHTLVNERPRISTRPCRRRDMDTSTLYPHPVRNHQHKDSRDTTIIMYLDPLEIIQVHHHPVILLNHLLSINNNTRVRIRIVSRTVNHMLGKLVTRMVPNNKCDYLELRL
jgi:hypothetical protein